MKTGVELIAYERSRQINEEGWTENHDDRHEFGEIAGGAAAYALSAVGVLNPEQLSVILRQAPDGYVQLWAWKPEDFKPTYPIRDLIKAGAMIAAEIDRRLRARENPHPFDDSHDPLGGVCLYCGEPCGGAIHGYPPMQSNKIGGVA